MTPTDTTFGKPLDQIAEAVMAECKAAQMDKKECERTAHNWRVDANTARTRAELAAGQGQHARAEVWRTAQARRMAFARAYEAAGKLADQ
jgi:hypothetical protein